MTLSTETYMEQARRRDAFARRVLASRLTPTEQATPTPEYLALQQGRATQAQRNRQARQARQAEQLRQAEQARYGMAREADTASCDYMPVTVTYCPPSDRLTADDRATARDLISRERLSQSPVWHVERALLQSRAWRLAQLSEDERTARRAEHRTETQLLAQSGVSSSHRCLVTDDTWIRAYHLVPRIDGRYHAQSLGSRLTLRGYGSPDVSHGCTVAIRHRDSDGCGLVSHDLFDPEPTEQELVRQAIARERARQAREARQASEAVIETIPVGLLTEVARYGQAHGITQSDID